MKPRARILIWLAAASAAAFCAAPAARAAEDAGAFVWNEANAAMGRASTSTNFANAAELYSQMILDGYGNARVYYNYGTALLLAGEFDASIDALRRAEILGGSSPAIRHNLELALKGKAKDAETGAMPELSWTRVPFFWHFTLPIRTRLRLALACFNLLFIALLLWRIRLHGLARGLFAAAAIGLVVFGSSAAVSARHLASGRPAASVDVAAGAK